MNKYVSSTHRSITVWFLYEDDFQSYLSSIGRECVTNSKLGLTSIAKWDLLNLGSSLF